MPKWNRVEKDVHWFGAIRPSADNQRPENVKWRNWDLKQTEHLFRYAFFDELEKVETFASKTNLKSV